MNKYNWRLPKENAEGYIEALVSPMKQRSQQVLGVVNSTEPKCIFVGPRPEFSSYMAISGFAGNHEY